MMKNKVKILGFVLSVSLSMLLMVSCVSFGKSGSASRERERPNTTSQGGTEAPVQSGQRELIKFFSHNTDDVRIGINNAIQSEIGAAFPEYDFEFELTGEDYPQKLQMYNVTRDMPDIAFIDDFSALKQFITAGNVIDLLPYINDSGFNVKFDPPAPILPGEDGKLYAVHPGADNLFVARIFYRKDIFEELGIEVPKTWDDFLAAGETLKANGIIPMTSHGINGWSIVTHLFQNLLMADDPSKVEDLIEGRTDFYDPAVLAAMERVEYLFSNNFFHPDSATLDFDATQQLFVDGQAAMYTMFTFAIPPNDEETSIMNWPSINADTANNIQVWGGPMSGYVGSSRKSNSKAIADMVMWCVEREARYFNENNMFTALQTGVEISDLTPVQLLNKQMFESAATKHRTITNFGFSAVLYSAFSEAGEKLMTGQYSAQDVVDTVGSLWATEHNRP